MEGTSQLATGAVFAGDFRIERVLGKGGMGAVYLATQLSTDRRRALKLLHPTLALDDDLKRRFAQEARVGARIESDHIVAVIGAGVDAATGVPWLAMELLEGEDLAARLARGPLAPSELRHIAAQLFHALGAAHAAGVVHRDLKPANIFLERPRRADAQLDVKVLDFGIAKLLAESTTSTTGPMGTPAYMAPEQTAGGTVSPATDVWALGLIVFELCVGKRYWVSANTPSSSAIAILQEMATAGPPTARARAVELGVAPERVPTGFDTWFARCLARDPAARFADANAAFAALLPLLDGTQPEPDGAGDTMRAIPDDQAAPAVAQHPIPTPTRAATTGRLRAVVAVAVALAIAAGAALWWQGGARPTPPSATVDPPFNPEDPTVVYQVPVGDSPVLGAQDAPVTIVEFGDFECPFSKMAESGLPTLRQRYGDKVRLVWKDFPFGMHTHSATAAALAREARAELGDAGFWRAHDLLFASQPRLEKEQLVEIGHQLGLDPARVEHALATALEQPAVIADIELADRIHMHGIPTFFVNGHAAPGAEVVKQLPPLIDAALGEARSLEAAGIPRAAVYQAATAKGRAQVPPDRVHAGMPPPVDGMTRATEADADAITVHEVCSFESFACTWAQVTLDHVLARYGRRVRRVWWPLVAPDRPDGLRAVHAANLSPNLFWKMHDRIFASQRLPDWGSPPPDALSAEKLRAMFVELGGDASVFDYSMHATDDRAFAQVRKVLAEHDIDGVPAFVVGDRVYGAETPEWQLDRAVQEELKKSSPSAKPQ